MLKYFISYEDLLENNKLDRNINLGSKEVHIIRKNNNKIKIEPLYLFSDFKKSFKNLIHDNNYTEKGVLLVELTEDEKERFCPVLIKTYEKKTDGSFEKVFEKDNIINLINYNVVKLMEPEEYEKGAVISLMPCVSAPKNMYISLDRENNLDIIRRRDYLNNMELGCDLYFYTNDEILLERYKDSITKVKEIGFHTYELIEHKVFVIDSLSQDRMIDWTYPTYALLDNICFNSIPVNIIEDNDNYELKINDLDNIEKKGYVIKKDINMFLYDNSIFPIIKYINVYELRDGIYKKIPLYDYLEQNDILKYIKKPT